MDNFRINVIPAADDGCGMYRMVLPTNALKGLGVDVQICDAHKIPRPSEVVVIQRPLRTPVLRVIDEFHAIGTAVVIDVDDDFTSISSTHSMWASVQAKTSPESNSKNVIAACNKADLVTVTTPALAQRYGKHGRYAILPNYVPEAYFRTHQQSHLGTWIGWTGTVRSHPRDLQQTGGGVAQAVAESGADFAVVGDINGVAEALRLPAERIIDLGWSPFDTYAQETANFDVGIVPLNRTQFNEAKSDLKGKEMAALGVPFVASPTGPYAELARHGIGELASSPADWYKKTLRLLTDSQLRKEKAELYRANARSLTIEGNCGKWLEAWETALLNFRKNQVSRRG